MRTIRTKVYKFSELAGYAKINAVKTEVHRFRAAFNIEPPDTFAAIENEKHSAASRLVEYDYEFLENGDRYYSK